ncbi:Macrolide export ATP-binding/permease protein MacB [Planctomycetales bacterium 10988]|nr:Macrolide export ATP-binding/permease protein MacB [Planctomycetales bacterium 10988]
MFKYFPYLIKGLWGHRTRTLLTVSGTAVALFVFCFVNAVQHGLSELTNNKQAERTLIVFQENRFCPQSSKLPQDYTRYLSEQPEITDVVPIKVFTNNCRASLDSIVFQGMPAEKLKKHRQLEIVAGQWSAFEQQQDAALMGQAVAQRRGIQVGEKFTIGDVSVVVAGVFTSNVAAEESLIYTHLDFLQRAKGQNEVGIVTQLEVHTTEKANVDSLAARIDQQFRGGPVSTTTRTKGMFQTDTLADLAELIGFIHYLGFACVGLVLGLVATTTVMSVQDRIQEHGVLQTIGLRPRRIFQLVVFESTLLSTLGGILGIGLGMLYLYISGLSVSVEGITIAFRPSWEWGILGLLTSILAGLLAGLVPGMQAAQTKIVNALQHVG